MTDTPNPPSKNPRPWFEDDDHALKTGFLAGTLWKAGVEFNFVKDDVGNYKPFMEVVIPGEEGLPSVRVTIKILPGGPDAG